MSVVRKALVMAAVMIGSASTTVTGQVVNDFSPIRTWDASYCFTRFWYGATAPHFTNTTDACLGGSVKFGYSASLAEYGFFYGFAQQPMTAPPPGSFLQVEMQCLIVTELPGTIGSCALGNLQPIGSQFFSDKFDANAEFRAGRALISWFDADGQAAGCGEGCASEHDLFATVLPTPEPSTFILVASGAGMLFVMQRRRRRHT